MSYNFQSGNFNTFTTGGRCKITQSISHENQNWSGLTGNNMALLDDPRLIDNDGWRLADQQIPLDYTDPSPASISFNFSPDAKGKITYAVDGAWLRSGLINVKANQTIRVLWNFLVGDHRPGFNDFALMEIIDNQDRLLTQQVLYQASQNLSSWASGWQRGDWTCGSAGTVSVKIIICNAHQNNPGIQPDDDIRADATRYPSGLLIDSIQILF